MTVTPNATLRRRPLTLMMQMASPALPVGAFAYSQGIERAVHDGWIANAGDAQRWIFDLLRGPIARWEAPVWLRLYRASAACDGQAFAEWNTRFVASRETRELREETLQMGASLAEWASAMALPGGETLRSMNAIAFPAAFAACVASLAVDESDGLTAYLWSWVEHQATAAMKAVPLGQSAGQRMLLDAHPTVDEAIRTALRLEDDELVSAAPGLALASALHEIQYSRLFRS